MTSCRRARRDPHASVGARSSALERSRSSRSASPARSGSRAQPGPIRAPRVPRSSTPRIGDRRGVLAAALAGDPTTLADVITLLDRRDARWRTTHAVTCRADRVPIQPATTTGSVSTHAASSSQVSSTTWCTTGAKIRADERRARRRCRTVHAARCERALRHVPDDQVLRRVVHSAALSRVRRTRCAWSPGAGDCDPGRAPARGARGTRLADASCRRHRYCSPRR